MHSPIEDITDYLKTNRSSSMALWLKRLRPDIKTWLEETTKSYTVKNIMERVYIILNGEPPKCKDNNYRKFDTFEKGYRTCCNLGNKCSDVSLERITKQQAVLLKKYGVTNAAQIPEVQTKIKNTNLKRYGTEHHSQNNEVKKRTKLSKKSRTKDQLKTEQAKRKSTSLSRYGVEHHMMLPEQQQKVQTTNIMRYGSSFPLQNTKSLEEMKNSWAKLDRDKIRLKRKQTVQTKYGVSAVSRIGLSSQTLEILDDKFKFCDYVKGKERSSVLQQLDIADHTLYLYAKKYDAASLFSRPLVSKFEIEVADWLTENNVKFTQNDRTVIAPKELDFYLPEHNIAIECCGLYWHSENSAGRGSSYHKFKFDACKQKQIQLITIFDDEWNSNAVKSVLNRKLNSASKIFARKCKVVQLTTEEAKSFCNSYHIQQYVPSKVKIGLKLNDVLVAVMTFGSSRFDKKTEWELLRYCTTDTVVGGASRLLSYFIKHYSPSTIISYSDNRWFTGNLYEKLGFKFKSESIGYFYTDYVKRFNRIKFQKHILVNQGYNSSMTEWEIMQQRNFDRIWDCGQIRWELNCLRLGDK